MTWASDLSRARNSGDSAECASLATELGDGHDSSRPMMRRGRTKAGSRLLYLCVRATVALLLSPPPDDYPTACYRLPARRPRPRPTSFHPRHEQAVDSSAPVCFCRSCPLERHVRRLRCSPRVAATSREPRQGCRLPGHRQPFRRARGHPHARRQERRRQRCRPAAGDSQGGAASLTGRAVRHVPAAQSRHLSFRPSN